MKPLIAIVLLCAACWSTRAHILLNEGFAYADGGITNVSSKWRHTSGALDEVNVSGGRVELSRTETEDVEASLSATFSSSSAAVLYTRFSLLVIAPPTSANGSYFAHLAGGSARDRIFVAAGTAPGRFRVGLANGTSTASAFWPVELNANQTYTVMTRWAVSNAQATLWINPLSPNDISISATDVVSASSASVWAWRQDSGIGTLTVDDLTVATSFREALAGNESPLISDISNQIVVAGNSTAAIPFSSGDSESAAEELTVFAQAADSNLVQSIVFDGIDSNRLVTVTAPPGVSGTTTVTVFVTDGVTTNSDSFLLTIFPALVFADDFSYPDGVLITNDAPTWVHHGGTITGEVQVVGGKVVLATPQTEDVSAALPYGPFAPNSGLILYASFIVNFSQRPGTSGDYFAHFNTNGARCRIFANTLNAAPGKFRFGIANGASTMSVQLATDLATNTNHLVVVRYNPATAASTLWVNPVTENSPGTNAVDVASTSAINLFGFRESSNIGIFTVDDLRVGLSFAAVTTPAADSIPKLRIARMPDGSVRLTWPLSMIGFTLQYKTDMASPFWDDLLDVPSVESGENVLINWPLNGCGLYRLKK